MRIKVIVPFPFAGEALARREAQLPAELRTPGVSYDFVPVKNSCLAADSYYELALLDAYILEAGVSAEDEGYDAVVIETCSDSGLSALRSRLAIPVIGPGQLQQHVAAVLGRRFSILTMWKRSVSPGKTTQEYGTRPWLASVRSADGELDVVNLLTGKEDVIERLVVEGRKAVEEDGADVILLGSTTLHQAVPRLREALDVPVIDPGPLAIKMAELLVSLGLSHSKRAYHSPQVIQDEKLHSLLPAPKPL